MMSSIGADGRLASGSGVSRMGRLAEGLGVRTSGFWRQAAASLPEASEDAACMRGMSSKMTSALETGAIGWAMLEMLAGTGGALPPLPRAHSATVAPPPPVAMMQLITGAVWMTKAIYVAAKLG